MPYPTGTQIPTGALQICFFAPYDAEDPTNNWWVSAFYGALLQMTNPYLWDETPGNVTAEQAAEIAQKIYNQLFPFS